MKKLCGTLLLLGLVFWLGAAYAAAVKNGNGSDIVRRWIVCQYVHVGQNPWRLAKETLISKYGEGNPNRVPIYAIPQQVPAHLEQQVLPELGPPEATYPPPAVGLLSLSIGILPSAEFVLRFWFGINVLCFAWVATELARLWTKPPLGQSIDPCATNEPRAPNGSPIFSQQNVGSGFISCAGLSKTENLLLVVAMLLLYAATFDTFVTGQFSLLVLALLLTCCDGSRNPYLRGLALGVALLKPSLTLPFFLLLVCRREWRVLSVAGAIQALATGYVMWLTKGGFELFRDWLAVAGYFLQGQFTIQEWINRLGWDGPATPLIMLSLLGLTLWLARDHAPEQQLTLAAVTSLFWTYHGPYDFVVLLPLLMPLMGWRKEGTKHAGAIPGIFLFLFISLALLPPIYQGENTLTRIMRWLARLSIIGLFVREYWQVYWAKLRPAEQPIEQQV